MDERAELPRPSDELMRRADEEAKHKKMSEYDTFYDVAARSLHEQMERNDALERKASVALSFASAILPVSIALMRSQSTEFSRPAWITVALSIGAYAIIALLATLVQLTQGWSYRPHLKTLRDYAHIYSDPTLRAWVADEFIQSVETNETKLVLKARQTAVILLLIPIEVLLLTIAVLIAVTH